MAQQDSNRNPSGNATERGVAGALTTKGFAASAAKFEEQFARLIPTQLKKSDILSGKRVVGLLINSFMNNDDLRLCRPSSILNAAGLACAVGLEFNNSLGQSAIIPYNSEKKSNRDASWQMMYRGAITLAMRSEKVAVMQADVVMEQDEFDFEYGSRAFLRHKPADRFQRNFDLDSEWRKAYCFVRFKDGAESFRVLDRDQIELIRNQSSQATSSKAPWNVKAFKEEMIRKTPVKQHAKYMDLTQHLNMAVGLDDQSEAGASQDIVLDWKDYSAEDIDHEKKTQTQGAGESKPHGGQPQAQTGNGGDKPTQSSETLWPEDDPQSDDRGPFTEASFTPQEFESLLTDFKAGGFGQTKAQFVAHLSKWRDSKVALIHQIRSVK